MRDVKVKFGVLEDFFGIPGRAEGFTIVPALVQLNGTMFGHTHPLAEVAHLPPLVAEAIQGGYDVAWVRARIPQVFGFTPENSENEKTLLDAAFLAVETGSDFAYPFHCSDVYGKTGLIFSPEGPQAEMQDKIARAFWSLLLRDPEDLADFEAKVNHLGGGFLMTFGCSDGDLYYRETKAE